MLRSAEPSGIRRESCIPTCAPIRKRPSGSVRSLKRSRSCGQTRAVHVGAPRAAPRMTDACEAPRRSAPRGPGARRIGHEGAPQGRAHLRAVPRACARRRRSGQRRAGARSRSERRRRRRPPPRHGRRHSRRCRRRRRRRRRSSSRLARGLTSRAPSRLRRRRRRARCCVRCSWSSCATCATARDTTLSARRGGAAGETEAGPVLWRGLCCLCCLCGAARLPRSSGLPPRPLQGTALLPPCSCPAATLPRSTAELEALDTCTLPP